MAASTIFDLKNMVPQPVPPWNGAHTQPSQSEPSRESRYDSPHPRPKGSPQRRGSVDVKKYNGKNISINVLINIYIYDCYYYYY